MKENLNKKISRHLSEFAKSFVEKDWIERWLHFLIEKPEKAFMELVKFERHRNKKTTSYFENNFELEKLLGKDFEKVKGIYFDGFDKAEELSLFEAFESGQGKDALFSIQAGRLAIFFFHEGEIFLCNK